MQSGQEAEREPVGVSAPAAFQPASLLPTDGQLVLPTSEQFELVLADATRSGKLPELHKAVAALEAMAKRLDVAFEELHRLAVFRLRTERSLGALLARTVVRGGDRSKVPRGTPPAGLPDWVTKKQSSVYQRLAAIPDETFERYLGETKAKRKVPSSAGARRHAAPPTPVRREGARAGVAFTVRMPDAVIDAAMRCLGHCDVLIGEAKVRAGRTLKGTDDLSKLRGRVLAVECREPAALVAALVRGWSKGEVSESIAILPVRTGAGWFQKLGRAGVTFCLLAGERDTLVVHLGMHSRGFELLTRELGVIARTAADAEPM